jgi:hypothetical protein
VTYLAAAVRLVFLPFLFHSRTQNKGKNIPRAPLPLFVDKLLIRFPASAAGGGEESTPLNNSQIARGRMIISDDNEIESEHGKMTFFIPFQPQEKNSAGAYPQEKETRVCDRALAFFIFN